MAEIRLKVENLLSYAQAAKLLGVTRPYIYSLVAKGQLRSLEIGGRRFVIKEDVERLTSEKSGSNKG